LSVDKRVIHDRRKEIYRLHDCAIPANPVHTSVVSSGCTNE
jgi:hypothetical protein